MHNETPTSKNALSDKARAWLDAIFGSRTSAISVEPDYYRDFFTHSGPVHPENLLRIL